MNGMKKIIASALTIAAAFAFTAISSVSYAHCGDKHYGDKHYRCYIDGEKVWTKSKRECMNKGGYVMTKGDHMKSKGMKHEDGGKYEY